MQHFNQQAKISTSPLVLENITTFVKPNDLQRFIHAAWRRSEPDCVRTLLEHCEISSKDKAKIDKLAVNLIQSLKNHRHNKAKAAWIQGLLRAFSLSSQEGVALMCLAEALLRIPDQATRDRFIQDKILQGQWQQHIGQSPMLFVNAAAWGLMLTGKIVSESADSLTGALHGLFARLSRGAIRKAFDMAMRMMGQQFVTGETIAAALNYARPMQDKGFRYSYDMLGEAALTQHDAQRYYQDYEQAIHAIGQAAATQGVYAGPGISIKLSALHPRYQRAQIERVHAELYPKVLALAILAKQYNIGLNIDAEETERLDLSIQLLEHLCFEPELKDWQGLGFVIQAYQKRCFYLVDYVIDLAQRSERRLMIRLVKGAYWDSEIKKTQIEGLSDYPVFTRKVHTDLSYLVCAQKLLAAPSSIYPQFATHNAQTVASIYQFAQAHPTRPNQYEFQCLHGMGESLYQAVVGSTAEGKLGIPCRIYAPVGNHETLLAYLVRRLLENGANSSFVHQIADPKIDIETLIQHPNDTILHQAKIEGHIGLPHPSIVLPSQLYQGIRHNAQGIDLNDEQVLNELHRHMQHYASHTWQAQALGLDFDIPSHDTHHPIINPADQHDIVGLVHNANKQDIEHALTQAQRAELSWANTHKDERAACLKRTARLVEEQYGLFVNLLCRESGKTYANAVSEIRETVDFLYYYAAQIQDFTSEVQIQPLGTVLCISPWNFPLAIFSGQIAAALVSGNPVIAKPAEQTPLIATEMVKLFWQAGIPKQILQLLPGSGEYVGAQLVADSRIQGVMFTGSTVVAKHIQQTLSQRVNQYGQPVVLIAETGGLNAMLVDSTALTEQVVQDAVMSAFDSAGQRCSALRLLCVQEDNLEQVRSMLLGAMHELQVGNPTLLRTDIGPVIDAEAQGHILQHIEKMQKQGYTVHQAMRNSTVETLCQGTFVPPTLIEIPDLQDLQQEVFGPVLHLLSYKANALDQLMEQIHSKGYGLTMGLHTRMNSTMHHVTEKTQVGNLYINRNIVGAVVGVQPFGGEGLSGTGPKAGGPLYIYRLMHSISQKKIDPPFATQAALEQRLPTVYHAFVTWLQTHPNIDWQPPTPITCPSTFELKGPTGESNLYRLLPREQILALAEQVHDTAQQMLSIFAIGGCVVLLSDNAFMHLYFDALPDAVKQNISLVHDLDAAQFDAVIHHGSQAELQNLQLQLSRRQGPILPLIHCHYDQTDIPIERLVVERAVSINTTAAGGNTSLMTLSDA